MKRYIYQSYEQYKTAQLRKYEKKKHVIFAAPEEMVKVAEIVRRHVPNPSFGICHGVRTGYEVWMLRKLLDIEVIGTDIASVERPYGGVTVVCWDFHNRNPEWVGKASFVYSNSWDHSYNPELMLGTWMEQLAPDGVLVLAHTPIHAEGNVDEADCLSLHLDELLRLVQRFGTVIDLVTVQQWRNPRKGILVGILRRLVKRKPIKEITLIVARPKKTVGG